MEMLKNNIVMEGCGYKDSCNYTAYERVSPTVGAGLNEEMIKSVGLANAYVPVQPYVNVLDNEKALVCGTSFGDLVMPYVKGSSLERNKKEDCKYE